MSRQSYFDVSQTTSTNTEHSVAESSTNLHIPSQLRLLKWLQCKQLHKHVYECVLLSACYFAAAVYLITGESVSVYLLWQPCAMKTDASHKWQRTTDAVQLPHG